MRRPVSTAKTTVLLVYELTAKNDLHYRPLLDDSLDRITEVIGMIDPAGS